MRTLRKFDEMRPVSMEIGVNKYAEGSCLIKMGDTHVMCTATIDTHMPAWMRGQNRGWITAEYGMLPRSTGTRMERESKKGQSGRSQEIQRLIGRSLRAVVDLKAMPDIIVKVDCDVIQADGGTRTASVTGGFVAMYQALNNLVKANGLFTMPVKDTVSAISCGIVDGEAVLDLEYDEDSIAETDSNFVITGKGGIVEIQGTAEGKPFSYDEFNVLYALAVKGNTALRDMQKKVLGLA